MGLISRVTFRLQFLVDDRVNKSRGCYIKVTPNAKMVFRAVITRCYNDPQQIPKLRVLLEKKNYSFPFRSSLTGIRKTKGG